MSVSVESTQLPPRGGWATLRIMALRLGFLGCIAVILFWFLAGSGFLRDRKRLSVCEANLREIGTGLYSVANDSTGVFWQADWPPTTHEPQQHLIEYTQAIGSYRSKELNPSTEPGRISTTRGLWTLLRMQYAEASTFVCPRSRDKAISLERYENFRDFGNGRIEGPVNWDQAKVFWSQISYGIQVPFGRLGRPDSDMHPHTIIAADKGPFGAAIDAGLAPPPPCSLTSGSKVSQWIPWNSPNHGGQGQGLGQCVLFQDGHVEALDTPLIPRTLDNIYTRWSGNPDIEPLHATIGQPPAPGLKLTPASNTDTLIYP